MKYIIATCGKSSHHSKMLIHQNLDQRHKKHIAQLIDIKIIQTKIARKDCKN